MNDDRRAYLDEHIVVWIARVSLSQDSLILLESHLDGSEHERAARFRFPEDRARFALGRSLLRLMLGRYLNRAPGSIELGYTERGRPILARDEAVQFSISHTGDLVAVALTTNARVGIDLENMKGNFDPLELAKRVFSEEELQIFQSLPDHEIVPAFFRAWTRKEAYLKARGEGISDGLQQISVSFGPEEFASIHDSRDVSAAQTWRLRSLPVAADYAGSLAYDDAAKRLECSRVQLNGNDVILESIAFHPSR